MNSRHEIGSVLVEPSGRQAGRLRYMDNQEHDPFDDLLIRLEPNLPSREARYIHLRLKMYKFFEWGRCKESWERADETLTRLVKNVRAGEHVRSYSYVYTIAQYVFSEYRRMEKRDESIANNATPPTARVADPTLDCKKECMARLEHDKRELLERYYSGEASEDLAEMLGISVENLRLRIHRIKKKLMQCYHDCLKGSGPQ